MEGEEEFWDSIFLYEKKDRDTERERERLRISTRDRKMQKS